MPLYDYKCTHCGKLTEVRHGFDQGHDEPCLACGGLMTRVFNPASIVFKGSGFYVNDSRKSGGAAGSATTPADAPSGEAPKSDAPKSDGATTPAPPADAKPAKASEPAA